MRAGKYVVAGLAVLIVAGALCAAPFDRVIEFTQPGGEVVQLHGWGDEFYAVFETLDGYSVAFDHEKKAYCYAALSADGRDLLPTQLQAGKGDPQALGLTRHARISAEVRKEQAAQRQRRWEEGTHNAERWAARKAQMRAEPDGPRLAPPASTTVGEKVGLCLLIDFSDDVGTISQANIDSYCNGDGYTGYGNNGSVKEYFHDVSNSLLTYTNVVTAYVRVLNSKDYYCDTNADAGVQANYLIRDAIDAMRALPNYETEILPTFAGLTVDGSNYVVATNVFYAGGNGGVWAYGLWPHSWSLYEVGPQSLSSGGAVVWDYQITNIGSELELGTFCHENGHMLCDFPDIYDYDYDSYGGAGVFCLMGWGGDGGNPVQVCAYLKYAAGWTTVTELTSASELTATLVSSGDGFNHFYRYAKPGVATEYFLLENRRTAGRDADIPASGVAVWHVDELGDRDDQSRAYNATHSNYEVTLEQADGLWHFQNAANGGDANDLFYSGNSAGAYTNTFTDTSSPSARWWSGALSGLRLTQFSAAGTTMTVEVGGEAPPPLAISTASLPDGLSGTAYSATLEATGGELPYSWWVTPGETLSAAVAPSGGVAQGCWGDEATWVYTLPFTFPYMGISYTSVYISSNGYLDFANPSTDFTNSSEELAANARIAPLWDDLHTLGDAQPGEDIYLDLPDADTVVIRWVAETYNMATPVNFDVLLRRNGEIAFHYGSGNIYLSPTVGLGSGDADCGYLLSTHNGHSSLGAAQTSTFGPGLPSGLVFDGATAEISGAPTLPGATDITFVCHSADGQTVHKELELNVEASSRTLSVNSTPITGVAITSTTGEGGTTDYQATVHDGDSVTLTAPATKSVGQSNYHFVAWTGTPEGTVFSNVNRTIRFTVAGDVTLTAEYALNTWTLRVQSRPTTGVEILSSSGHGGTTNYQMVVEDNLPANLTAPASANGLDFVCWENSSGEPLGCVPTLDTNVNSNLIAIAAYAGMQLTSATAEGTGFTWGQRVTIQWTSTLPPKSLVAVELWNDDGDRWPLGTSSKGLFSWTVGAWKSKTQPVYPQGDGYRIRVSSVADDTVKDWSDYPFSIGSVTAVEITGADVLQAAPTELAAGSLTQFTCKGIMNFGDPQNVTAGTTWRVTNPTTGASMKCAKMGKTGILATTLVATDTTFRLTATFGKAPKGGTAPTASVDIVVRAQ